MRFSGKLLLILILGLILVSPAMGIIKSCNGIGTCIMNQTPGMNGTDGASVDGSVYVLKPLGSNQVTNNTFGITNASGSQLTVASDATDRLVTSVSSNGVSALNAYGSAPQFQVAVQVAQTDAIPTMTSNTAPSGVASASTEISVGYEAYQAFADSTAHVWSATTTTGWIAYEFVSPKTIATYTITPRSGFATRAPKDWTFEGWTGSAWVVLDTRNGVTSWTGKNTYSISAPASYIKYRLNVTAINGDVNYLQIEELEMMESTSTATALSVDNTLKTTLYGNLGLPLGVKIIPASDSTTAIQITKADGTTPVLTVDTTNKRVGINTTPLFPLHVAIPSGGASGILVTKDDAAVAAANWQLSSSTSSAGIFAPTFNFKSNRDDATYANSIIVDTNTDGAGKGAVLSLMARTSNGPVTGRDLFDFSNYISPDSGIGGGLTALRIKANGNTIIGSTSDNPAALLAVNSTSKYFMAPRMTGAQKEAIAPTAGALVFDTTNNTYSQGIGSAWSNFVATGTDLTDYLKLTGRAYQSVNGTVSISESLVVPVIKPATDSTTAIQIANAAGTPVLTVDTTNGYVSVYGSSTAGLVANSSSASGFAQIAAKAADGKYMQLLMTGPSYTVPSEALFSINSNGANTVPMEFMTDGQVTSGGTSPIYFTTGGYLTSNRRMTITSGGSVNVSNTLIANQIGVGTTAAPVAPLEVYGSTFPLAKFERTTGADGSTGPVTTNQLNLKSTYPMVDGFGPLFQLTAEDSGATTENSLGSFGAVRSGADNSGAFVFWTYNAGTGGEKARITPDGNLLLGSTSDNDKAILALNSTTKGFLPPRMTGAQKEAIASAPAGLIVWDSTNNTLSGRNSTGWMLFGQGGGSMINNSYDTVANVSAYVIAVNTSMKNYVDAEHANFTGKLTMRPSLNAGKIAGTGKPTAVTVGAHAGYSMPVYAANDEELFFREYVAGRWDGASDINVSVIYALSDAEDAGDKFKFQLSWENTPINSGAISASTTDVPVETTVAAGRTAQYSVYTQYFPIDWDLPATDIAAGDHIGFRIRRIAASSSEVSNEIIVLDTVITYNVNKVYKAV